ncbi:MAG: hypothetical protein ACOCRN_04250 [Spirochaetia bacterium]
MKDMKPERIMDLHNGAFASLVSEVLEDEGIPHRLVSYYDTAYAGVFQFQAGVWGHIEAPPQYRERIEQIVADLSTPRSPDSQEDAPED